MKILEILAMICAVSFAPVFLIKILLNNHECIKILEPIPIVRYTEAVIALFVMIILIPKIYRDIKLFKKEV